MQQFLPESYTSARKQGFSPPDSGWFKAGSHIHTLLTDKDSPIYAYMNYSAVQNLLNEHIEGKSNRRLMVWSLLSFTHWCRKFL